MEKVLQTARIKTHVSPREIPQDVHVEPFQFIYDHPDFVVRPERSFEPLVEELTARKTGRIFSLRARANGVTRFFPRLNTVDFTLDEALAICRLLTRALNGWPDMDVLAPTVQPATPDKLQRIVVRAAICQACPDKPIVWNKPKITTCKTRKPKVILSVEYIDSTTGKAELITKALVESTFDHHVEIPGPENIIWGKEVRAFTQLNEDVSDSSWACVSMTSVGPTEPLIRMERCARYLNSQILRHCSPLKNKDEMHKAVDDAYDVLRGNRGWPGRLRHHRESEDGFFMVDVSAAGSHFHPSNGPLGKRNLEIGKFAVAVNTRDMGWVRLVANAGLNAWWRSGNVLDAWSAIAIAADDVNERIHSTEESPCACHCSPVDRKMATHPCAHCGGLTPCQHLDDHPDGYRACEACRQPSSRERLALWVARRRAWRMVEVDARKTGVPAARRGETVKALRDEVERLLEGDVDGYYTNAFSGKKIREPTATHHPLNLSIDSIFPAAPAPTGGFAVHAPNNIGLVPLSHNLCKHAQLAICSKKIGEFCSRNQELAPLVEARDPGALDDLETREVTLIRDCTRYAYIRLKLPWKAQDRRDMKLAPEVFRY